ncbi:hypothetical protein NOR53_2062 [gamma proteobacterium NOR5-3]|nr:hypothetical protein NOR53_2062 [gamma proteobacterium NOR5-3]
MFLPEIGWGIDFRDQGDADRYARAIRRAIELSQTASDDLF